ncbi:MAG TPA: metal-binding protein [Thermosynechococcaceae cyanobacterium]
MPSGRTHDSITLWSLPFVAGITLERTQSPGLTLWVSSGFLFSGLMFGPDLDIYSQQFKRWGVLRWIWLPYQRSLRHRSVWSHAPIVGTLGRIGYLLTWLGGGGVVLILGSAILGQTMGMTTDWRILVQQMLTDSRESVERSLQQHWSEWLSLTIGLELGALLHSFSDWASSTSKRMTRHPSKRLGLKALQTKSQPKVPQGTPSLPIPPALPRFHSPRPMPRLKRK